MNDNNTWFKMYRKILQWEWFQDSKTLHVFIFLLIRASIKTSRMQGKTVRRGQVITSYPKIAAETGMSVSSARRAVENLISTGEITSEPTNRYSLITIVKYDLYQEQRRDFEQTKEQSGRQAREQTTEHRYKKRENVKNVKKEKSKTEKSKQGYHSRTLPEPSGPREYVPQYFELNIPKQYHGRFETEDEWWIYVEAHREEVEKAYEL